MKLALAVSTLAAVSVPAHSQSAFDGFRIGFEGTASWSRMRVDGTSQRDATVEAGRERIAKGEADLAAGRASLAEGRASLDAGRAKLDEGRAALNLGRLRLDTARATLAKAEASAAAYRTATGRPTTPFDSSIASGRVQVSRGASMVADGEREVAAWESAVASGTASIESGSAALTAGEARMRSGREAIARLLGMPTVVTPNGNGQGVRVSVGWGTTHGRLHIGVEGDIGTTSEEVDVLILDRRAEVSHGLVAGVGLRAGWVVHPRVLIYGSAGWEGTEWKYGTQEGRTRKRFQSGGRVGAGVEVHVGDGFLIRAGYDRSIMGTGRFLGADISPSRDTVRLGLVKVL